MGIQLYNGWDPDNSPPELAEYVYSIPGDNVLEGNYVYHNGYVALARNPEQAISGVVVAFPHARTVIRNNRVCDNAKHGILIIGTTGDEVSDNIPSYNQMTGIYVEEPGLGEAITRNITYNEFGTNLGTGPDVTSDYNNFFSSSGSLTFEWEGIPCGLAFFRTVTDRHSTTLDPQFAWVPTDGFDWTVAESYDFTIANPALNR